MKIWFAVIPSLFLIFAFYVCEPTTALFNDWRNLMHLGFIILITLLLGFFSSYLFGWFVLGPLYHNRGLKNGAPFQEGDVVQIIAGPYRDRVVNVYATWQGDSVRVMLGENERLRLLLLIRSFALFFDSLLCPLPSAFRINVI